MPPRVLRISEIFDSVQGEGPSAGLPCTFLRLIGCNLSCTWCDSKYTWDFERYSYEQEMQEWALPALAERLGRADRIVITGGEPLLQHKGLAELLALLDVRDRPFVEVETNGTLAPEALLSRINQWNVSPKLQNAGDPLSKRVLPGALVALRDTQKAFLKFVLSQPGDLAEVQALVEQLSWPQKRVYLMAQGQTREELASREPWVAQACLQSGYRMSPRMHVQVWGDRRGV